MRGGRNYIRAWRGDLGFDPPIVGRAAAGECRNAIRMIADEVASDWVGAIARTPTLVLLWRSKLKREAR